MPRPSIACTTLLALALAACSKDPVSQQASGDHIAADASRDGDDFDSDDGGGGRRIAILDACDPTDPAWAPTGGCARHRGPSDVSFAEFNTLLSSPLSLSVIGHPAWRNQPSGGGRVPPLNQGLTPAPECLLPSTTDVPPGGTLRFTENDPGIERYQCCIHPWMRALIRVTPGRSHEGHGDH